MPIEYYKSQIEKNIKSLKILNKKQKQNFILRSIVFVAGTIISILLFKANIPNLVGYLAILVSLIGMILLAKQTHKIKKQIFYNEIKKINNENELKALDFDFSEFNSGEKYTNPKHNFSFDLDIFGENSIFQMLCRANTEKGRRNLSGLLSNPFLKKDRITEYQNTVAELKNKPEFLQQFKAKTKLLAIEEEKVDFNKLDTTEVIKTKFTSTFWGILLIVLPTLCVILATITAIGEVPISYIIYSVFFMFALLGFYIKYINKVHNFVTKQFEFFETYSDVIKCVEKENFENSYLQQLQEKFKTNQKTASEILKKYSKLLDALDNRLNIVFIIIADGLFLWDIQVMRRIEKYVRDFMTDYNKWFEVINEMETLVSLAVFAFNNPEYVFPAISEERVFEAKKLGHTLINSNRRVANDFVISGSKRTFIVTGANMAGKSTFLRTIGVNQVLAQIGSVVCAEKFETNPFEIITSIRITDSLASDESYFYAELLRLQKIIKMLDNNSDLLIIIDEMLRGTNSLDKHKGSEGLLRKLTIDDDSISILATHDVALGELENEFPENVKNYCFEAQITNDELYFDYKLREGISQNLNASFLMKKMGIID